ncbi:DUF4011 domain-containing protein [Methanobrevibacter filiformis]|uniref:Rhodanese domain-containing protein n=1 Tax=Methanobrevibacter filiformis TaxID=55758 RepID=A0A166F8Z1_9EURY|nr:DUF4011 domain-containing protein [Methanobrevibacter filiformis]KZX17426.1 hypothetical protein MBFIL_01790 [Methanobrevibacter filiformis]
MVKTSSKKITKEFENLRKNLLDLTSRNQLLNFKPRAKTLEVINNSPTHIYQVLVLQEKKMQFIPKEKSKDNEDSVEDKVNKKSSKFHNLWEHPPIDLTIFKEGNTSLQTNLTPSELQKRLFYINQQAKTMLQEQGYNILYLAIGFLEWKDNIKPKEGKKAPLVLIPMTMKRKKVGKSFSLYWSGEEIQTNISLKAKLKEEGLDLPKFSPKPYIEAIDHYFKEVKNTISKSPATRSWKIIPDIALGFFSFTKFVMYNDLDPNSWKDVDLTQHELIDAIFNPKHHDSENSFKEEDIDFELSYNDMYHVLDADSSQIAAIEDVKAGKNLVVEGPPGTGKSQTIVNLIAELLASGKSVLFVSEKMAALEVVKSRLDSVGLGKFILELHSHKTRRKQILKELQKSLHEQSKAKLDMTQIINKLDSLKLVLDNYAEVIHKQMYEIQMSPYELYGLKELAEDQFTKKNMILPLVKVSSPESVTKKELDDIIGNLESLAELYEALGTKNPWNKCSPKSLLPGDLREIELLINDSLFALDDFVGESNKLNEVYGIKVPTDITTYKKSLKGLELLENHTSELIDSSVITNKRWYNNPEEGNYLIEQLNNYQKSKDIMDKFKDSAIYQNLNPIIQEFEKFTNKKFKLFSNKSHKDEVKSLYKPNFQNKLSNDKAILKDLKDLKRFIKQKEEIETIESKGNSFFGELWHLNTSIKDLKNVTEWMSEFSYLLKSGIYTKRTIELFSNSLFDMDFNSTLEDYVKSGEEFYKKLKKLESKLNPRSKLIFKKETDYVSFDKWRNQLNEWKGQLSSLHLWSQYLNIKDSCLNTSARGFVKSIEERNIKKEDVRYLVYGNFADSLLNIIFQENETLSIFIGELHENKISEFDKLDLDIIKLNRKRIFYKLSENTPKIFGETDNEEAKILAGEFTRKQGHLPLRTLLEKAGGIVKQIKPCFMMSPLSIAQYLDPTNPKLEFDVVIFDEASQVKPEDALGAFMRAKTAVVMGDTQQLPPTSFFDQLAMGESEEETATALDMESILHLCKLSFPVRMLKWHYRSRHESLINVSNKEFYDNQLLVYPSPSHDTEELGLKSIYNPDTIYDKGKSSSNRGEAREVVKEIFNHLRRYGDKKSLGVGTFSVAQMNAILEELEIERKKHPEMEPLFSDKNEERFFVKNLETIQGDERDVILISIGYGFDQFQKMTLNFGPLNQEGGERRLNVLITRAREKCIVFSNFKSYDMHLTSNPPFGVKALKNFLSYAENLSSKIKQNQEIRESENFEDSVYNFLIENNYEVDKQVGAAGFKIDLAIVDENNPGKYLLGIECDGEMYSSSRVARDRDRLRQQVLIGLGWKLYRLWSTDWYRNREISRTKLLDHIKKVKEQTITEELQAEEQRKAYEKKLKEEIKREKERLEREKEQKIAEEKLEEERRKREELTELEELEEKEYKTTKEESEHEKIEEETEDENKLVNREIETTSINSEDETLFEKENTSIIEQGTISGEAIIEQGTISGEDLNFKENFSINDSNNFITQHDNENNNKFSIINNKNIGFNPKYNKKENKVEDINDTIEIEKIETNEKIEENNGKYAIKSAPINEKQNIPEKKPLNNFNDYKNENTIENNINDNTIEDNIKDNEFTSEIEINEEPKLNTNDNESNIKNKFDRDNGINKDNDINKNSPINNHENELVNDNEIKEDNEHDRSNDNKNNINFIDTFINKVLDKQAPDNEVVDEEYKDNFPKESKFKTIINSLKNLNQWKNNKSLDYNQIDSEDLNLNQDIDDDSYKNDPDDYLINKENEKDENITVEYDDININSKNIENIIDNNIYETTEKEKNIEELKKIPEYADNEENNEIQHIEFTKKESIEHSNLKKEMENHSVDSFEKTKVKDNNYKIKDKYINPKDKIIFELENTTYNDINADQNPISNSGSENNNNNNNIIKPNIIRSNENKDVESSNISYEVKKEKIEFKSKLDLELNNELHDGNVNSYDNKIIEKNVKELDTKIKDYDENNEVDENRINQDYNDIKNMSIDNLKINLENEDNFVVDDIEIMDDFNLISLNSMDNKLKSVTGTISEIKSQVNYINKSLREIEDPIYYTKHIAIKNNNNNNNKNNNRIAKVNSLENNDFEVKNKINNTSNSSTNITNNKISNNYRNDTNKTNEENIKNVESAEKENDTYRSSDSLSISSLEKLYNSSNEEVAKYISDIVTLKGPIHKIEVIAIIKESCNTKRATPKLKKTINNGISEAESSGEIFIIDDFLFSSQNSEIQVRKRNKPNIDLISNEEIEENIKLSLKNNSSLFNNDLVKEVASKFGFRNTSAKTTKKIINVIDSMIVQGIVINNDNKIQLNNI